MKKFLMALATTAMVATPLVSAEAQGRPPERTAERTVVHQTVRHGPNGRVTVKDTRVVRNDRHDWRKGQRFDRRYARNYTVIQNPRAYRLNAAPRGYHWVRSGNDAVMVAITSGIIGAVVGNAIR